MPELPEVATCSDILNEDYSGLILKRIVIISSLTFVKDKEELI